MSIPRRAPGDGTEQRLEALRERRADLAMIAMTEPLRKFDVRPFMDIQLALLVSRKSPLACREQVGLEELARIRYIAHGHDSATFRHVERTLRDHGMAFEPAIISDDSRATRLLVEIRRGETFGPLRHAAMFERTQTMKVVPVPDPPPIRNVWAARDLTLLPQAARDFIEVADAFKDGAPTSDAARAS